MTWLHKFTHAGIFGTTGTGKSTLGELLCEIMHVNRKAKIVDLQNSKYIEACCFMTPTSIAKFKNNLAQYKDDVLKPRGFPTEIMHPIVLDLPRRLPGAVRLYTLPIDFFAYEEVLRVLTNDSLGDAAYVSLTQEIEKLKESDALPALPTKILESVDKKILKTTGLGKVPMFFAFESSMAASSANRPILKVKNVGVFSSQDYEHVLSDNGIRVMLKENKIITGFSTRWIEQRYKKIKLAINLYLLMKIRDHAKSVGGNVVVYIREARELFPNPRYSDRSLRVLGENAEDMIKDCRKAGVHLILDSLHPEEKVLIYRNGIPERVRIADLYEQNKSKNGEYSLKDGYKITPNKKIETISFDKNYRVVKNPIKGILRHRRRSNVYELKLTRGKSVKITEGHSVFALKNGKLTKISIKNLKKDDFVAVPKTIPSENHPDVIYLRDFLKSNYWVYDGFSLLMKHLKPRYGYSGAYEEIKNVGKRAGYTSHQIANWKYKNKIPLNILKLIDLNGAIQNFLIMNGSGHTKTVIPNRIPINDDLMWFFGFFIAEGYLAGKSSKRQYQINVCNTELGLVEKFKRILDVKFNMKPNIYTRKYKNGDWSDCYNLNFSSRILSEAFKNMGIGDYSYNKRVPKWVFMANKRQITGFLDGYWDGDGIKENNNDFMAITTSKQLSEDIMYLILRLGYIPSINSHVDTRNDKFHMVYFVFYNKRSIRAWNYGKTDIRFEKVKEIKLLEKQPEYVYDLSVPGTENFLAGTYIFCKNTQTPWDLPEGVFDQLALKFIFRHDRRETEILDMYMGTPSLDRERVKNVKKLRNYKFYVSAPWFNISENHFFGLQLDYKLSGHLEEKENELMTMARAYPDKGWFETRPVLESLRSNWMGTYEKYSDKFNRRYYDDQERSAARTMGLATSDLRILKYLYRNTSTENRKIQFKELYNNTGMAKSTTEDSLTRIQNKGFIKRGEDGSIIILNSGIEFVQENLSAFGLERGDLHAEKERIERQKQQEETPSKDRMLQEIPAEPVQ